MNTISKSIVVFLFSIMCNLSIAQVNYDNWPSVETNDRNKLKNTDEFQPFFNLIGREWDHRIITYSFQNNTLDLTVINQRQAIRNALDLWAAVTDLAFLEVCNGTNADIAFSWGTQNHGDPNPICYPELGLGPFDGENGTIAHSMGGPGPNDCGNQAGDIHFDDDETWTTTIRNSDSQPIDLETVAAHEIGHSLGLFHTNVSGSLMAADYAGSHRFLGSDDIAGIRSIYGAPASDNFVSGPNLLCSTNTFTLEDLPTGSTATWSVTPSSLFAGSTSGSGTTATLTPSSSTSLGQATLTYTITTPCGNTQLQRVFWVGKPATPIIYSQDVYMDFPPNRFTVEINSPAIQGVTSYNWYLDGVMQSSHTSSAVFNRRSPFCGRTYYVEVEAINACGTSVKGYYYVSEPSCFTAYSLRIAPNPATSEVEIAVLGIPTTSESKESEQQEQLIEGEAGELVLYDRLGNQLYQQELQGGKATLDVGNLKPGTYVVKYYSPEGTLEGKLLRP
ncbi:matrixin family metalloprotease [Algoriphagus sp. NG3]|uniref:matrixin family metalloprotease n=1 Tax=Algoriphagus sp. NG3 TaxID=3097546 RepID=UPI002A81CC2C|nr:matrixin family metalloprotease [Algoriphagus sp. NG3]WPR75519.1 matrixin family metalloprotease [Algoriphagus sp. NG3]